MFDIVYVQRKGQTWVFSFNPVLSLTAQEENTATHVMVALTCAKM